MWTYPATLTHRLSPAEERLLEDFLARLLAAAPPGTIEAVRVFGSRARGDSNVHSDLDVAVVLRPGVEPAPIRSLATDTAFAAADSLDALDLGLAVIVLAPGAEEGVRAAIARDGFDLWRAPW
jgi:predicted nucleotidyltransferase